MKKERFVRVNTSKSGNGHPDYRIRLPSDVVDSFCLSKGQELKLDLDPIKQRIILSLKFEDIPSYDERTKRLLEKRIKKRKIKIVSSEKITTEKYLHKIKNSKHKDKKELVAYHEKRLKQLKK